MFTFFTETFWFKNKDALEFENKWRQKQPTQGPVGFTNEFLQVFFFLMKLDIKQYLISWERE